MTAFKKVEWLALVLAWVLWTVMEITSWNHFFETPFNKVVYSTIVQSIFGFIFNYAAIIVILSVQKKIFNTTLKFLNYGLTIIISSIFTVICSSVYRSYVFDPSFKNHIESSLIGVLTLQKIVFISAFTALFFMLRNLKELQFEKKKSLEAENLSINAQLSMLQQQINPHFLFNTLNSLRNLIVSDSEKARHMVTNLSELLRDTLQTNSLEITIKEELRILEYYLDIQKIRWSNEIEVIYYIHPRLEQQKIPAFILQPLVENVFKHGMKTGEILKLKVVIQELDDESLLISIRNNGVLKNNQTDHEGGNMNIKKRLNLLYNEKATFSLYEKNGYVYSDINVKFK